ncbi:MAG: lmo0937 family membrane protein [Candidatus Sulfotelmatobacter sp.]|jgi:hypothetical protein
MVWTIFVVLLVLWLLGFSLHFGGALIHLLLVVALAVLIINLLSGRRTAVCQNTCLNRCWSQIISGQHVRTSRFPAFQPDAGEYPVVRFRVR